jgi:hypothetical protein
MTSSVLTIPDSRILSGGSCSVTRDRDVGHMCITERFNSGHTSIPETNDGCRLESVIGFILTNQCCGFHAPNEWHKFIHLEAFALRKSIISHNSERGCRPI